MKCEEYRNSLIEKAAGGEFDKTLAIHLEECTGCRVKLQHDEQLFAAIDQSLRSRVNGMPSGGFATGVHARLREQVPSKSQWSPALALAGAAVALVLIVMLHPSSPSPPDQARKLQIESAKVAPHGLESEQVAPVTYRKDARVRRHQRAALRPEDAQVASGELEVLVPPDEGKAFHLFISHLHGQGQIAQAVASSVVRSVPDEKTELPEIAPIEIARLRLEPLTWEDLISGKANIDGLQRHNVPVQLGGPQQ